MPTSTQLPAEIKTFPGFHYDGDNEGKLPRNVTPASNDDMICAATATL